MYTNIGKKIKILEVILCCIGILTSFIASIVLFSSGAYGSVGLGFAVLIFGSLFAWVGSFFTYGFGQLIEHAKNIDMKLNDGNVHDSDARKNQEAKRIQRLNQMLEQGLITQEEYNAKVES